MAERTTPLTYTFDGGFATDLSPETRTLTHLTRAENCIYQVSKAIRKFGGANRLNGTQIASGANITGMYDAFYAGTSGSFTRRFVILASDGTLHTMDSSGTIATITGGASITANTVPVFAMLSDILTFWTSDNDTPLQITVSGNAASLTGSPPAGRGAFRYANRLWIYGINATPSSLRYSAFGDPQIWSGPDSGLVTVDDDDNDRVVAGFPYKGRVAVFKGPNIGSIHILGGKTIQTFAVEHLISGVPLQSSNGIISVGDDVWFLGDNGVYSLAATERFGNFQQADLTRFLKGFFRDAIDRKRMSKSWGVNYSEKQTAIFTLASIEGSEEDMALGLSYIRAQEEGIKPFIVKNRDAMSAALRVNPTTNVKDLVFGSSDGYVLHEDHSARILPGSTAYNLRVTTPSITIAPIEAGDQPVQITDLYMKSKPSGAHNVTVDVTRDSKAAQQYNFEQGTTGAIWGTSVFGTGKFGGGLLQTIYPNNVADVTGEAKSIKFDIQQGGANEDAEIYELGITVKPTARSRTPLTG